MTEAEDLARRWDVRLAAFAGAWFLRLLRASLRLRFHGDAAIRSFEHQDQRFVLASWHRHMVLMRWAYRGRRVTVLSSQSKDGEMMVQTLRRLGVEPCRGSTTRGGVAGLRAILRKAAEGYDVAFTPDGPRGPERVVQPGVLLTARLSGLPIVPVAYAATRDKVLRTWDRLPLPKPFSRVHMVYGETMRVEKDDDLEERAAELARRLNAAEAEALRLAGRSTTQNEGSE
jgi:lysophospholipid acyltransferase (LPLAT)-like uncharacterized protein